MTHGDFTDISSTAFTGEGPPRPRHMPHRDNRRKVRGQIKHDAQFVLGHADTLYRLFHVRREAALEDFPEIADVVDWSFTTEIVCCEILKSTKIKHKRDK